MKGKAESLEWLNAHFVDGRAPNPRAPVKVFVTGEGGDWTYLEKWPPVSRIENYFPDKDEMLGRTLADESVTSQFTYGPADPTPTIGGRFLFEDGVLDASPLAEREDALDYTSETLIKPLEVIGNPHVTLMQHSNDQCVDVFVRVSEVDSQGRSCNVSDGFCRLGPSIANGLVQLELDAIAHRFAAGNRIHLLISGGSFPHWERNLGSAVDPASSSRLEASTRSINLSKSSLELQVRV
jgi:putative CocE/NonD family hydrolase